MKCKTLFLRINPQRIYFFKFILEGYDGLGVLSTIDSGQGLVMLRYPSVMEMDLFFLLSNIAVDIK